MKEFRKNILITFFYLIVLVCLSGCQNIKIGSNEPVQQADEYIPEEPNQEIIEETKENRTKDYKEPTIRNQRKRLKKLLEERDWSDEAETMVINLYDVMVTNYDLREYTDKTEKEVYFENFVDTIEYNVKDIIINSDRGVLEENDAIGWSDYGTGEIILAPKGTNLNVLRHEIAHLDDGTFLQGSSDVDLGFVFEEGRASYISGEGEEKTEYLDKMFCDISNGNCPEFVIENVNGNYPAFEEIYKLLLELGVDMESLHKENITVDECEEKIEEFLKEEYGDKCGKKFMRRLKNYIEFFGKNGLIAVSEIDGTTAPEARDELVEIFEECKNL